MKRHNEAWRDSLRYRRPDLDRMPGIRRITINNNPLLGDQGAILLAEALKDDLWLKALDLQCCGISSSGARTLLEVLKYNTTIVVLDVRRNPLVDRDVLHSIMEQLMLNCNGQDTEYKWIKAEENPETAKPSAKAAVTKKRRTKTLNISFGRKTTIKVPLSSARRRTRSAGSANGGVRNTSIRQASGLPWRTAARANRHRGFPPEHDPRCSSMYEGIDGLAPLDSLRPDVSVILTHEDSQREDTFGELDKLDLEESNLNAEAKGVRGVRVEFELLRRRLKEETEARKIAERRNMELSLENQRLKGKLVDRGSILEDDQVLESIENTFRQFHNFLDLLRDAGLGSLITMAGLDQDSMPFGQPSMSLSQTSRNGIPGNVSMKDQKLSTTLPRDLSAAHILKKNPEDRFAGDITSGVQVSTSCGSFEEGLPIAFGPESQQRTSAGIVMSDVDYVADPAMAGLDGRDDYAADLQAMKVDDLYERLVQDTRDVLNTDWDSKLQETQSKAKAKQPATKRLTKHTDEPKLSKEQDIDALSQLSKGDMPLPGVTASMDTLAESESINVSVAKSGDGGEHGDHAEPNKEHPGSRFLKGASDRNMTTPDLKSVQSEGNYSMDGFEQSYLSDRGEVVQDIDILGSLTPSLPKDNSDEDDF